MAKSRLPPIGFWSYVRRDDDISRGKVSQLRDLILGELEAQLGQEVPVFKDTASISHGARWEPQTIGALSDATFFIPVLTPNFLRSEWCCREVRLFLARQRQLLDTYPDLPSASRIFPIHYVDVTDADALDEEVRDTLMELQHLNFLGMRHRSCDDPVVQAEASTFVTAIRNLLRLRVEVPDGPLPGVEKTRPPTSRKRRPSAPRKQADDYGLDVVLTEYGLSKIATTKEVQALTGVTVRSAMAIVDGLPWPIARGVSIDEAMEIAARIEAVGGLVELQARISPVAEDSRPLVPPAREPDPVKTPPPGGPIPPPAGVGPGEAGAGSKRNAIIAGLSVAALLFVMVVAIAVSEDDPGYVAANYALGNEVAVNELDMDTNMTTDLNSVVDAGNAASAMENVVASTDTNTLSTDTGAAPVAGLSRQIIFTNACSQPLTLRLVSYNNGNWDNGNDGPWSIQANFTNYLADSANNRIHTTSNIFYLHAESRDGRLWDGSIPKQFGGRSFQMRRIDANVNSDGAYVVRLTCD